MLFLEPDPEDGALHADVFFFPTWAAQSWGVTAGSGRGVAGRGNTLGEGEGRLKNKKVNQLK